MASTSTVATGLGVTLLLMSVPAQAQRCLHGVTESAGERSRRQAAVRFVEELNSVQVRQHQQQGRYAALSEVRETSSAPVGFVPRLIFDRFGYLLKVTDLFDPCGFALFSDEQGVVFEAYPSALSRRTQRPDQSSQDSSSVTEQALQPDR